MPIRAAQVQVLREDSIAVLSREGEYTLHVTACDTLQGDDIDVDVDGVVDEEGRKRGGS
jgi:hypothetical protein